MLAFLPIAFSSALSRVRKESRPVLADSVETPRVTIVVIARDVRSELERCFASIQEHAGVPVETLLVDNASADGTRDWVKRNYPEVVLIEAPRNLGDAARELARQRARGEFVMFLDSDAALTAGALPSMVEALERNPDWGLIGPRLVYDDGDLQLSCRRFPSLALPFLRRPPLSWIFGDNHTVRRHLMQDFDHEQVRPVQYVIGACQLFRASLSRAAGPYDTNIFWGPSDIDWCIRIRDAGGEVVYFPKATVLHSYRRTTNKKPTSSLALRHLRDFYYFQWKYRHRRRELVELERKLDELH
jgi:N-acetylglucosaminyl-diphospho-decaprenol L-rhamnosyltransferase